MHQLGFLDFNIRLQRIDNAGDPLTKLNTAIDWEQFRPILEQARKKTRKSAAGAKGYDVVLLFKALILQSLYNLSDQALEFQILDRYSFSRFLGLHAASKVPDATTFWLFREHLTRAQVVEELFARFDQFLNEAGFRAEKGQIVDASIIKAPVQRNSRKENEQIKAGGQPEGWSEAKRRQKDVDARWTKKNSKSYFGYKLSVSVDLKHGFIRRIATGTASEHDGHHFDEVLDMHNTGRSVHTDKAYASRQRRQMLQVLGFVDAMQRRAQPGQPLSECQKRRNQRIASKRARVEHAFAGIRHMGGKFVRTIGQARATVASKVSTR